MVRGVGGARGALKSVEIYIPEKVDRHNEEGKRVWGGFKSYETLASACGACQLS
jgi:hypothetical protein